MKFLRMVLRGGPGLTTWFLEGVGQMTMFDHDGGRGVKISENLTTWYMDAPLEGSELLFKGNALFFL